MSTHLFFKQTANYVIKNMANRLKSNLKKDTELFSRSFVLLCELYLAGRTTIGACEKVFQRNTQLVGAGGQRWRAIISSYEPREAALRISSPWLHRKPPLHHLSFIKPTLCNFWIHSRTAIQTVYFRLVVRFLENGFIGTDMAISNNV